MSSFPPPGRPSPGVLPRHPLSVGDVLGATFRFFGRRFGQFLLISLIPSLVIVLAQLLAVALVVAIAVPLGMRQEPDLAGALATGLGLVAGAALAMVGLAVVAWTIQVKCLGMIALAARDIEDGHSSGIGDLWRRTRGLAGRALSLVLAAVLAGLLVSVLVTAVAVRSIDTTAPSPSALPVVVGATLLAQLAAIYLQVRWAFVLQALAIEADGPFAALGRSWRTTQGAFWRILGSLLAVSLLLAVVLVPVAGLASASGFTATDPWSGGPTPGVGLLEALAGVLGWLVMLLAGPFVVLFTTILFIDQQRRKGLEVSMMPTGPIPPVTPTGWPPTGPPPAGWPPPPGR